jgi:hypothetical protein
MQNSQNALRLRRSGALTKNSYANEIASRVNAMQPMLDIGQDVREGRGSYLIIAQITEAIASRSGMYRAKMFYNKPTPVDEGDLVEDMFGSVPNIANATLWNPSELMGGNILSADDIVLAMLYGSDDLGVPLGIVTGNFGGDYHGQIMSSTQDGTNKRWLYKIKQVSRTTGFGFSDTSGGFNNVDAYNLNELNNGASGTFGNAVSSTSLTGTFAIKAVPNGTVVRVERWGSDWAFEIPNGVDGACT